MKNIRLLLTLALCALLLAGCAAPAAPAPAAPVSEDEITSAEATWSAGEAPAEDAPAEEAPAEESDLAYITEKGKLTIGITIFEPMNYYDEAGKLIGFDTEFAEAVCAKLGVEPDFVEINWDTKETELAARTIDCIWNGLTITESRKQNMDFSAPYIKNMQVVVVKADNAAKYTDKASLSAANLVAEISSAGEIAIIGNNDDVQPDPELSKATYTAVAKQTDALLEVKAGTADAAVLDYTLAKSMVGEGTDFADLTIVEGLELAVEEYGIGFRVGSDVDEKVTEVLNELTADGTMDTIAAKYELTNSLLSNQ